MADALEPIVTALSSGLGSFATSTLQMIPDLLVAIILVILGWIVAMLARRLVVNLLKTLNFEKFIRDQELDKALGNIVISELLGLFLYYYIIFVFLQQAVDKVYLKTITVFMTQILNYVPALVGAFVLVILAALAGEFVKRRILTLGEKDQGLQLVARSAKFIVVYIGVVMALDKIGFNTTILNNLFLNLSTAIFYGLALAFGIAFGFGGQDSAKDWLKVLRARFRV